MDNLPIRYITINYYATYKGILMSDSYNPAKDPKKLRQIVSVGHDPDMPSRWIRCLAGEILNQNTRIASLESQLKHERDEGEILRKELNAIEGIKSPFEVSPIIMASYVNGAQEHGFSGFCCGTGEKYINNHKHEHAASLYYSKAYVDKLRLLIPSPPSSPPKDGD